MPKDVAERDILIVDPMLATGGSAAAAIDEMKKRGVEVDHIEGRATGWILLDYNDVLVHVFQPESRQYYNIERLWNDAARIDLSDVLTED